VKTFRIKTLEWPQLANANELRLLLLLLHNCSESSGSDDGFIISSQLSQLLATRKFQVFSAIHITIALGVSLLFSILL